jgi:transcription elongation factor Elf1
VHVTLPASRSLLLLLLLLFLLGEVSRELRRVVKVLPATAKLFLLLLLRVAWVQRTRIERKLVRKDGYEYNFECDTCDYGTDHSGRMKAHKEMHAGVRYHRPQCTHASTTRSSLQVNIRTIREERKDFECPVCHKEFGLASHLKNHREAVQEGVRHECPVADCDKSYSERGTCVKHIRLEHGGDSSLAPIRRSLSRSRRLKNDECSTAGHYGAELHCVFLFLRLLDYSPTTHIQTHQLPTSQ